PVTRCAMKRRRQRPTVWRVTRASRATTPSCWPVVHARTMRARCARACAVVGRRAQRSSVSTSSAVSVNGVFGRPRRIGVLLVYMENALRCYLVSPLLTRDTSLARPGGNVTGLTFLGTELVGKHLQLLKQTIP